MSAAIVTCDRAELLAAVRYAGKVATGRAALPVLHGLHLEVRPDSLTVTGSNLDLTLRQSIDLERWYIDATHGRRSSVTAVVPAKLLAQLLKAKHEEVVLTFPEGDDDELRVELAGTTFTVKALPADEFPRDPQWDAPAAPVTLDARQVDLLKRLSVAASRDDARPVLTALSVEPDVVVATDSYRLGWADVALGLPSCLLPSWVAEYLEPDAEVEVRGTFVRWWNMSGRDGWSALVDGHTSYPPDHERQDNGYPNWRNLVGPPVGPARIGERDMPTFEDPATVGRVRFGTELLPALKELAKAARDVSTPVRLAANGAGVVATVSCVEAVKAERVLPARFRRRKALPAAVAFNPGYLADVAKAVGGEVRMDVLDALRPARITGDTEGLTFLLMPVRVP